jgi:tRNA(fMet)-specific endonuclease VapC
LDINIKYLLDTDICIYWLKGKNTVKDKIDRVGRSAIAICSITVSELYFGAYNSSRIDKNLIIATNFIQSLPVISLNNETLKKFGQLKAQLRQAGTPIADFDLMIASVAITQDLILVTNNIRHYQRVIGLKLDNWSI